MTIAFDSSDICYIAYRDFAQGVKATVKKFDGNNWVTVGNRGFTPAAASFTSIAIGQDNLPYVAFRDFQYNYRASVMKFDGSNWVYLGTPGFTALGTGVQGVGYTCLKFDNYGIPYVAFSDHSNAYKAGVMKFDGSNWVYVGSPGISVSDANYTTLAFDSQNTPYIGFLDSYNSAKGTVMKFDGSDWVPVGTAGFTPAAANFPCLAIDKNDRLYFAYQDYANSRKMSLMTFDGTSWNNLGNAGFSSFESYYISLAIDSDNNPYVAYMQLADDNRATVMKYESIIGIKEDQDESHLIVYPNPGHCFTLEYKEASREKLNIFIYNSYGALVLKKMYPAFSGELKDVIDMSAMPKGIYLLELSSGSKKETKRLSVN
jgi:hypothetical protein